MIPTRAKKMTKSDLAEALKDRQRQRKILDDAQLAFMETFGDDEMIATYNRCAQCGELSIPLDELPAIIDKSQDVQEFIDFLDAARDLQHDPEDLN